MKRFFFLLILLSTVSLFSQKKDTDVYKEAMALEDPNAKIEALKSFGSAYPQSNYYQRSFLEITSVYLSLKMVDSALVYADKYINAYPADGRLNPYNSAAYTLVINKMGLDTALVYSQRAVEIAKSKNARNVGVYLDTQALVLYNLGRIDDALKLQTEAMTGNEDDPEYVGNLAVYQEASGNRKEALNNAARVLFMGDPSDFSLKFEDWLVKEKQNESERNQLKKELAEKTVEYFMNIAEGEQKKNIKISAASFYAKLGVKLADAKKWALEGFNSITKETSAEERIMYHKTMGIVYSAEKNYSEALKEMNLVKELVDPWDLEFWKTLGSIHETQNNNNAALDAYVLGLYAFETPQMKKAATDLLVKMNRKPEELKKIIENKRKELESFEPGKFEGQSNGNILLAELFTGAECNPCQGADLAFDKLSEYYGRDNLAILEYHLHIPGPDPMTNPSVYSRYQYYGANFGTPTVFMNGKEKITGGGPRSLAMNRFSLYKNVLNNIFDRKALLSISGKAERNSDNVTVDLTLNGTADTMHNIHIALVEKSIKYTGSNGVDHHIYVVRDVIVVKDLNSKLNKSFDVSQIEKGIRTYLDDPTKHPSWRPAFGSPKWKERVDTINRDNLAVVAWVQNGETKDVLNAVYLEVK